MINNIAPLYLSSLVPPIVQSISHYNLRNANDLKSVNSRTTQYFNSFLPSVIRDWNSLPCADRNVETINSFKRHLNQHRTTVPKYLYTGNRKLKILHTRLRLGCSSLNYDLFLKNIVESPLCRCSDVEIPSTFSFVVHYIVTKSRTFTSGVRILHCNIRYSLKRERFTVYRVKSRYICSSAKLYNFNQ